MFIQLVFWFLIALIHLMVVVHVLLNKHEESTSSLLWIFLVVFFPFIGILLYLVFGVNRLKTLGMKIESATERMESERDAVMHASVFPHFKQENEFLAKRSPKDHFDYVNTLDRILPETRPLTGNHVELLHDGTMAYPRMLEAIETAERNIHLQSFIISDDRVGNMVLDALRRKAENGVKVKILYDSFGSGWAAMTHFFSKYLKCPSDNLEINAFVLGNLFAPWRIQLRNHRKVLIIDGSTAFSGGVNISVDNDINYSPPYSYVHDLHCRLHGPAVADLQFSFLRDWSYVTGVSADELFRDDYFPPMRSRGDSVVRVVPSGPGQSAAATEKVFYAALVTARRHVWIMSPYLVPDNAFVKALVMAAGRGVEIRLITPRRNNHWFVKYACASLYRAYLEAGVRVFETNGPFSHSKAMIVDGEWAFMGSSNCDVRSFRLNYELDLVVSQGAIMRDVHDHFLDKIRDADEITLSDEESKGIGRRLSENACSLLTPIL